MRRGVPGELTVTCDCGWTARGPQADLVPRIREHARDVHGLTITPEQALAQTCPVEPRPSAR